MISTTFLVTSVFLGFSGILWLLHNIFMESFLKGLPFFFLPALGVGLRLGPYPGYVCLIPFVLLFAYSSLFAFKRWQDNKAPFLMILYSVVSIPIIEGVDLMARGIEIARFF